MSRAPDADGWVGLSDVQWMNIVNHGHAYAEFNKEDAVHEAVKATEAKLREINVAAAPAPAVVQAEVSEAVQFVINASKEAVSKLRADWPNTARTLEIAVDELAANQLDTERLDWLDKQGHSYGFEDMHEGNRWVIDGPFSNLRAAIDAARGAA